MTETPPFKKTTKQRQAINLLSSKATHCLLYGGSRAGKSFIIIYALIVRCCKVKSRHILLRLAFNAAKTSLWLDTIPKVLNICFPNLKVSLNKTDYYITFPNGSELWVGGLDDAARVEKILGKEYSSIFFNECSQMSFSAVQMSLTRLAEKNALKKKAYYDLNPNEKTSWVYYQFIKGLNPSDDEPLKNRDNYKWLHMSPQDNLENVDTEYLDMLVALPKKERIRFLEGKFRDVSDGAVYYAFNSEVHVRETKRAPGTLYLGVDFNVDPMTAIICQLIDGVFLFHDELFLRNANTPMLLDALKRKGYFGSVIPDSTCRNRKTSGRSDFELIKEAGYTILDTRNPYVMDRCNNVNRLLTQNRAIIDPKCKKLINDLVKVSWKKNKLDQKTNPLLTHISDAMGYVMWKLDPIVKPMKSTQTVV